MIPTPPSIGVPSFEAATFRGFDQASLELAADAILRDLSAVADAAKVTRKEPAIDVTSRRLARAVEKRAEFEANLATLVSAEATHRDAIVRYVRAVGLVNQGTLDGVEAVQREHERVMAYASEHHQRRLMPALRSAVSNPLESILRMKTDDDGRSWTSAVGETELLLEVLMGKFAGSAPAVATKQGSEGDGRRATFWPVAEVLVTRDLRARLKGGHRQFSESGDEVAPAATIDQLEQCFAQRRSAFESARARAAQSLAALAGP